MSAPSGETGEPLAQVLERFNRPGRPMALPLVVIAVAREVLVAQGYDARKIDEALFTLYGQAFAPVAMVATACPSACATPQSCLVYGCRLAQIDVVVDMVKTRLPGRLQ